jgi:hypothetical protein
VSQERERAVVSVIGSFVNGFQLRNRCLSRPYSANGVHWTYSYGESRPSEIAASAVSGLKVDPGG